eukprot:TRINITY_DN6149_c0_g1_i2.p1 TRINITY_DN6149_c0_g1~~TRINITY_DN6149_c0_g1_i2.p1  ORF type:complete len:383 (+),score=38.62 TRINITY_DN6149_c0_g1_i2:192-1340(+)
MAGEGDANMAETPNWRISVLFLLIVVLSLVGHLFLHWMEEYFRKNKRKGLKHTLESLKDELFALGLITLMLIVLEDQIIKICIKDDDYEKGDYYGGKNETLYEKGRRLLAGGAGDSCKSGYEPLWSLTVLHDTHIFIFLIAVVHLVYAATSIILASLKVRGWRKWEDLPSHDMRPLKKKWTVKTKGTYFGLWISAFFHPVFGNRGRSDLLGPSSVVYRKDGAGRRFRLSSLCGRIDGRRFCQNGRVRMVDVVSGCHMDLASFKRLHNHMVTLSVSLLSTCRGRETRVRYHIISHFGVHELFAPLHPFQRAKSEDSGRTPQLVQKKRVRDEERLVQDFAKIEASVVAHVVQREQGRVDLSRRDTVVEEFKLDGGESNKQHGEG